jgi:soluble lytic murein transglycosylase-like protein
MFTVTATSQTKRQRLRARLPSLKEWLFLVGGAVIALGVVGVVHLIHDSQTPIPYQPNGITASWIAPTVKHWSGPIDTMAKKYDIDPNLVAIIMTMESGGDPKAQSPDGAIGLMQVTPTTAKDIAARLLKQPRTSYNLKDPTTNIEFGVAYLAWLRDQFGTVQQGPDWTSTVELVAAGYNGGPGAANDLEEGKGLQDTQTVVYSRDAFNMWRERHASDRPNL